MNESITLDPNFGGTQPGIGIRPNIGPNIGFGPGIEPNGIDPSIINPDVNPNITPAVSGQDPVVTGFIPDRGVAGDWVQIGGSNFFNVTRVEFNGAASNNFFVDGQSLGTRLTAQVPAAATTGRISVVRQPVPGGIEFRGTSINPFFVRPRILAISPLSGPAAPSPNGTTVTIPAPAWEGT
jgi:hypothetical protein